jgi:hypothetical protein
MLLEKIRTMITVDHDEDFKILEKDNKIYIFLDGIQFKKDAKIIIDNYNLIYRENNSEYNYNSYDEYDLLSYLDYLIDKWIDCNSPTGKDNFKNFFL